MSSDEQATELGGMMMVRALCCEWFVVGKDE